MAPWRGFNQLGISTTTTRVEQFHRFTFQPNFLEAEKTFSYKSLFDGVLQKAENKLYQLTSNVGPFPNFLANYVAGVGDALTFGITRDNREFEGIDVVDTGTFSYNAGEFTPLAVGALRLGYIAVAKTGSVLAPTAEVAWLIRDRAKVFFRFGLFRKSGRKSFEELLEEKSKQKIKKSSGKTNRKINTFGLYLFGSGETSSNRD